MKYVVVMIVSFLIAVPVLADQSASKASGTKSPQSGTKDKDDVVVSSKTKIDFNETLIEGKMQAPQGFFLQGRQAQDLSQMVKLRSNFRPELRNSKSAVRAVVK